MSSIYFILHYGMSLTVWSIIFLLVWSSICLNLGLLYNASYDTRTNSEQIYLLVWRSTCLNSGLLSNASWDTRTKSEQIERTTFVWYTARPNQNNVIDSIIQKQMNLNYWTL